MPKYLQCVEDNCGAKVLLPLHDALGAVEVFFMESDPGDKMNLEIVEMTEAAYLGLPESDGC